jgi:hypothetical protein
MASVRGDLVAREVLARAFARSDSFARENNRCGMTEGPKERPGEWAKRGSQASAQLLIATAVNFTAAPAYGSSRRSLALVAGQMLPSHLEQAGSAIRTIEQVQERKHDRTSLFDQ